MLKKHDVDYARYAAKWYADLLPWMEIMTEIKKELKKDEKPRVNT
jgi:putative sterol carrier protein